MSKHVCEPPEDGGTRWTCPDCGALWSRSWQRRTPNMAAWLREHVVFEPGGWLPQTDLWARVCATNSDLPKHRLFAALGGLPGVTRVKRRGVLGFRGVRLR